MDWNRPLTGRSVIVLSGDWQERKFPSESRSDAEISGVRDCCTSVHASFIWPVAAEIGITYATAPCTMPIVRRVVTLCSLRSQRADAILPKAHSWTLTLTLSSASQKIEHRPSKLSVDSLKRGGHFIYIKPSNSPFLQKLLLQGRRT